MEAVLLTFIIRARRTSIILGRAMYSLTLLWSSKLAMTVVAQLAEVCRSMSLIIRRL